MAEGRTGGDVAPDRLIGERIAGRFVVERLIGQGELSTAFRAHDDRLHRRVTVKLFHPRHADDVQVVDRQLAAARAVARLSHEHIAMVIDRGEHEGQPLIVLEHVRGENLHERIERYAPLAVGEVVGYGLQTARALAYAHGHGVLHGNLRPANVLLTEERDVKLVDFGGGSYVAQLVGDPFAAPELREVEAGTPPEPSDDIYALGALLFVSLTEQAPVPGIDPGELQLRRPDVSPRLAAAVARALAADPEDRFLSMREFAAELSAVREAPSRSELPTAQPTQAFSIDDGDDDTRDVAADRGDATRVLAATATPARRAPRRRRGPRSPRETRARILAWSIVVAPLAALIIFGVMIAGERGNDQITGDASAVDGPSRIVPVASVTSFDPEGDGSEHEELVANVIDDDPDTTWSTDGYDTQDLNGAKPGVGVVLQLDAPRDVRDVVIDTTLPGWTVEVRAADAPSSKLADWRPVSEKTPVEGGARIPVDLEGAATDTLLLWITRLSIDTEDTNRARARIGEVRVFAVGGESDSATDQ